MSGPAIHASPDSITTPLLLPTPGTPRRGDHKSRHHEVVVHIEGDGGPEGVRSPTARHTLANGWDGEGAPVTPRRRSCAQESNPFDFLGVPPMPQMRPACTIDPFRNHTPTVSGAYEWIKMVVCLPLALVRLAVFAIAITVGFLATKLALQGWKDKENPMPMWRRRIMWVTRICARVILFAFGYQWIKRKGRPVSRDIAPIIVSNHVSYIEPIFYFYELFPTMVSSESHDSIPFVGTIIRAMQVIYVDRFSARSRKHAVHEIKRKASCNEFPRVLLFPEGTTTNGRTLISFQHGAFIPGVNIQPVVVRYPYVHFDQSWGNISLLKLMLRMFSQFHNFMEVEYLPVVSPPASKLDGVSHFADETSYAIASALNITQTCHSYSDVLMHMKASQLKKEKPSAYMVEMAWLGRSFNITTMEALEFLDCFLRMNPDPNGRVCLQEFAASFMLGCYPVAEKVFKYLDVEKKGSITFRQFLVGSANVMKQPSFRLSCDALFDTLRDNGHNSISMNKLSDAVKCVVSTTAQRKAIELFYQLDMDKDGSVNRNDFMTFMQKNPLVLALFPVQPKAGSEDNV